VITAKKPTRLPSSVFPGYTPPADTWYGIRETVTDEEIPQQVRRFLSDHIESVVQMEILLLLHANPARAFSAADVGRELRIEPEWATTQLANLSARGILSADRVSDALYRYDPQTPQLDAAIAGLARAYTDRRVSIIGLIYSKPTDQLQSFADAFRLRREKDNG
jgi:hypothetical protein